MRFLPVLLMTTLALALHADETSRALIKRGGEHEAAGRLAEAARDYKAAHAHSEKAGDREGAGEALIVLGYLQYYQGEMNEALVNLQRGYEIARALGQASAQQLALSYIAHVYADASVAQYDRAIEYYQQILAQYEKTGSATGVADTTFNIASTYERKGDLEPALQWYRRALAAEEKLGRTEEVPTVKRSIGVTLGKLGRNAEALPILEEALRAFIAAGNHEFTMHTRQSRGIVQRRMGNNAAAIADLEATRRYYTEQKNTRYLEKSEEELALAYSAAGRWREAYDARTRHAALQRELAENLREDHTSRLRVQFDTAKKEQENRALLRDKAADERIQRLQTIILILGAAIIAVLAYLMWRMRVMAMTDELTRLPNRRHLLGVARAAVDKGAPFSLVAFDIDHFKRINDTWGHAAGDIVLQRVAQACRSALRRGDRIGRTGGEEFTVVLPATHERDAAIVAERMRAAVEAVDCSDIDPGLHVTISLGVAQWTLGDTLERIAGRADELLYRAKETGRNRVMAAA